jgi:hypothetical protein
MTPSPRHISRTPADEARRALAVSATRRPGRAPVTPDFWASPEPEDDATAGEDLACLLVPHAPSIDDVFEWISTKPSLDQVALRVKHARLVHRELAEMIRFLDAYVDDQIGRHPPTPNCAFDDDAF